MCQYESSAVTPESPRPALYIICVQSRRVEEQYSIPVHASLRLLADTCSEPLRLHHPVSDVLTACVRHIATDQKQINEIGYMTSLLSLEAQYQSIF